jgi:four helix bundle protein
LPIRNFEEIESWKEARLLTNTIYNLTNRTPFNKDYSLKDQIRRASVSIMSNIAEGFDSNSNKSFINFLNYSFRSTSEVQSILYVAIDQDYIQQKEFDSLYDNCNKIKSLIGGLKRYLSTSN